VILESSSGRDGLLNNIELFGSINRAHKYDVFIGYVVGGHEDDKSVGCRLFFRLLLHVFRI
jgi:hypothetical protein